MHLKLPDRLIELLTTTSTSLVIPVFFFFFSKIGMCVCNPCVEVLGSGMYLGYGICEFYERKKERER